MAPDVVACFQDSGDSFIITREEIFQVTRQSPSVSFAVAELNKKLPISTFKVAYVGFKNSNIRERENILTTLRQSGFKNVVVTSENSIAMSYVIDFLKGTFKPGEYLVIALTIPALVPSRKFLFNGFYVIQKQLHNFEVVDMINGVHEHKLIQWYPQIKSIVHHIVGYAGDLLTESDKAELASRWPGRKSYYLPLTKRLIIFFTKKTYFSKCGINRKSFSTKITSLIVVGEFLDGPLKMISNAFKKNFFKKLMRQLLFKAKRKQMVDYIWHLYDKKDDCLVQCAGFGLLFCFNDGEIHFRLINMVVKRVVKLDIKNAPQLEVYFVYDKLKKQKENLLKYYTFKTVANRIVAITITLNETLIPTLSIETLRASPPSIVPFTIQKPYFIAQWNDNLEIVQLPTQLPAKKRQRWHIGFADRLLIYFECDLLAQNHLGDTVIPFLTSKDRIVTIEFNLDQHFMPTVKLVHKEIVPPMVFEFSNDNRLLVHGPPDYKGPKDYPAYASFKDGNLVAGAVAFDIFKNHPEMVVYDIPLLLSSEFDCEKPNQAWKFSVSRDSQNNLIISMGETKTNPYICFALIVKSVFLNVCEIYDYPIESVGIKLPRGSEIADEWRDNISQHIGASIVVFNSFV